LNAKEVELPVMCDGHRTDLGYRIGLLVEDLVVVESKAPEDIATLHKAQLLSYLRLSQKSLGMLISFNVTQLKEGIHRVLNGFNGKPPS
jgi:GxxExxY protein